MSAAALLLLLAATPPKPPVVYGPELPPEDVPATRKDQPPPPVNTPAPATSDSFADGIPLQTVAVEPETTIDLSVGPRISATGESPSMELTLRGGRVTPLWGDRLAARWGLLLRGVQASSRSDSQVNDAVGLIISPVAGLNAPVTSSISLYFDAGAGLALYRNHSSVRYYGDYTGLTPGLEFMLAMGATCRVSSLVSFFIEPLGLRLHDAGPATAQVGTNSATSRATTLEFPTSPNANLALRIGVGIHL